uniref:GtrA family protein n=1 Tax=Algoriphagus sp. TaxID=1872435 RepID=UPI004047F6BC
MKIIFFGLIPKNRNEEGFKFGIYSAFELITTSIFGVIEFSFDYLFACEYFKYIGAIHGLNLGYIIKFTFDKKYLFYEKN